MTTTSADAESAVTIREATTADLLSIFRIEKAAFEQPWPFSAFEHYLDRPGFLVAEGEAADGAGARPVVGYVVADFVPNHGRGLGHIKDIAVHADYRGRGIGARLLRRALAVLRTDDADRVKLEVRRSNETAKRLYRSFGFEHFRTVPRYYGDGEDAQVMVCQLSDRQRF